MFFAKHKRLRIIFIVFVLALFFLVLNFLIYLISVELKNSCLPIIKFFLSLLIGAALFWIVKRTVKNYSIRSISKNEDIIQFKNLITGLEREYTLSDLDGYVTGRIRNSNRGSYDLYKVIWIVQNNKMIERIDERYVVNYNELEEELKELP